MGPILVFEECKCRLELSERDRKRECPVNIRAGHGSKATVVGAKTGGLAGGELKARPLKYAKAAPSKKPPACAIARIRWFFRL
ncbi:MAG: hypothetical protein IKW01_06445 [Firmicutes bacterium]|nr:hypothetical protein [Bacillota bacterium]